MDRVEKDLKNVKKFTIAYLKKLIEKYSAEFPRKTRIKAIEEIDRRAIETKKVKVGYDPESGFVGTKVSGPEQLECTNFDKLLILYKDGTYTVTNIPEKQYIENVAWVGVADKKTVINVVYKNKDTGQAWAKRFIVDKFILDKPYRYLEENWKLEHFSVDSDPHVELHFITTARQTQKSLLLSLKTIPISGAQTRGVRAATHKLKKVVPVKKKNGKIESSSDQLQFGFFDH